VVKLKTILELNNVTTSFRIGSDYYAAVDDVSITLKENETLAIVGESGSGKSALALSIMGLHNRAKIEGSIKFNGREIANAPASVMNKIRGNNMGMVFQDSLSALNPLMTVGKQVEEMLYLHNRSEAGPKRKQRAVELLDLMGLPNPENTYNRFPHELSGGMRQRIVIAIAVANNPEILIADEPTTALDVTIQSQIFELINQLKEKMKAGIILITHDLSVVAEMADKVAVMYAGQIVEIADVYKLFANPLHPYTRSLLNSVPHANQSGEKLHVIQGIVPSLKYMPRAGCRFSNRIPWLESRVHEETPTLKEVKPNHYVRCTCYEHFYIPVERELDHDIS